MRFVLVTFLALLIFTSRSVLAVGPPCSCIQELLVDYPGPYDLYFSLGHPISCYDTGEEELWFGVPSNGEFPQDCDDKECEEYEGDNQRSASLFPGHGQEFVGAKAWDVIRVGLESGTRKMPGLEFGTPQYHNISRKNVPANIATAGDMIIMAIPLTIHVKKSRFDGKTYYLCVQMDSAVGLPITMATFENVKQGTGSQLHINYRVNDDTRIGLVWLK